MTLRSGFAGRSFAAIVALSLAPLAQAEVSLLVGGLTPTSAPNPLNVLTGDQATLALDGEVSFAYAQAPGAKSSAVAFLDRHLFCVNVQSSSSSLSFEPRFQLPAALGTDVWKFPDFSVATLDYVLAGAAFGLRVDEVQLSLESLTPRTRCLTAQPGESGAAWDADRGLFSSGFGDYPGDIFDFGLGIRPPQNWPSVSHQNFKVVARQFPGHASGREVALVRVEVQMATGASTLRPVDVSLLDAFNGEALANTTTWCLLSDIDYDTWQPTTDLCRGAPVRPGTSPQSGGFVRQDLSFANGDPPAYVLVSRARTAGTPTAGQPIQAFAVLRKDTTFNPGVTEYMQDWYLDDSVWYSY